MTASNVTAPGGIYHYVRVAYSDNVAVAFGTIDANDVLVTGPGGYSQTGFLANLVHSAGTWTATYRVPAAGGPGGRGQRHLHRLDAGRAGVRHVGQLHRRRRARDLSGDVAAPLADVLVRRWSGLLPLTVTGRLKQGTLEALL